MHGPGGEQHGAFQHLVLGSFSLAESKQQSLDGVARQDSLKVDASGFGVIE
jgi:hypothetical protein